ncbi:hypothetical protein [Weissella halotolerans]|nr:hypothetical protein [Weissella halotolerans]
MLERQVADGNLDSLAFDNWPGNNNMAKFDTSKQICQLCEVASIIATS